MALLIHHSAPRMESPAKPRGIGLSISAGLRHIVAVTLCFLSLYTGSPNTHAQAQEPSAEYQLKAAFLYNFAKFVEWPVDTFTDSTTPFTICALGNDPFGSSLDAIAGKTVRDRALVIKRIRSGGAVTGCQILYVSPNELPQVTGLLRIVQKAPMLTVCDLDACAETGLMLNMRMADNRVQLDINLEAVQRTPLKVSSQLIKLTRIVKGQP
jgi:YfiR/HmsC-like